MSTFTREYLKPCWKLEKGHISREDQQLLFTCSSEILLFAERIMTWRWLAAINLSSLNILKYRDCSGDFPESRIQDFFDHTLNTS